MRRILIRLFHPKVLWEKELQLRGKTLWRRSPSTWRKRTRRGNLRLQNGSRVTLAVIRDHRMAHWMRTLRFTLAPIRVSSTSQWNHATQEIVIFKIQILVAHNVVPPVEIHPLQLATFRESANGPRDIKLLVIENYYFFLNIVNNFCKSYK